jgi:uncharacterized OB-fold protein
MPNRDHPGSAKPTKNKSMDEPVALDAQWWDATARHELVFQSCAACRHVQHPPRPVCQQCGRSTFEWIRHDGFGAIHSATQLFTSTYEAFQDELPYWVAVAVLEPEIYFIANMRAGTSAAQAAAGSPIRVEIEEFAGSLVPVIVPAATAPAL